MHSAISLLSLPFLLLLRSTLAAPLLAKRVNPSDLLASYDYVIVGGGTSGLTVGNRLSEDPNVTVLIIEAGNLHNSDDITIPRKAGAAMYTENDWTYRTVPQPELDNRIIDIPGGKLVGGSSALNGIMFDRGAASDYDAWRDLGNPGWGWSDLLPYFKKSETFTPPPAPVANEFGIEWIDAVHGNNGPIHSSFPVTMLQIDKLFFAAMNYLGIPIQKDGSAGTAYDAFWSPNSINPHNASRSWARTGYYDPLVTTRSNFHVLINNQVTKVLLKKTLGGLGPVKATGVEFAENRESLRKTVNAKKEVIIAAGAPATPKILQLSGIGPANILNEFGIDKFVDLPGVGSNYQDHTFLFYGTNVSSFADVNPVEWGSPEDAAAFEEYKASRTGVYTSAGPNGLAFLSLSRLNLSSILAEYAVQPISASLPPNSHPSVKAGYIAQKAILLQRLAQPDMSANEFMWFWGNIVTALQHEFTRGTVQIASSDPFDYPLLDPRYLANPLDAKIIRSSFNFAQAILQSPPVVAGIPENAENWYFPAGDDGDAYMRSALTTSFHSCGTCPMQPRALGGCVSPSLRVYGTSNLRVVDASIMPLIPGTHLQSTVYAVAEKAADIIKAAN